MAEHRARELEFDGDAEAWYVRILDEDVHHTTEGAPINIDWTRDGTMIGVEILGKGQVPRPARCGCSDAERLYDELEQAFVSACTERDALRGQVAKLAEEMEQRGHERDEIGDDDPSEDDTCAEEGLDCHTVSAVATWFRAARLVRAALTTDPA